MGFVICRQLLYELKGFVNTGRRMPLCYKYRRHFVYYRVITLCEGRVAELFFMKIEIDHYRKKNPRYKDHF